MVKSTTDEPLYLQLKKQIFENIRAGTYETGQKIPTENELSRFFSVSRITVRKALKELENEGFLVRHAGKGTFVTDHSLRRNIARNSSFTSICRTTGQVAGAKTIKSVIENATETDIQALSLDEDSKVIVLERIRYADGIPVAIESSRFPENYSFLIQEDLSNTSMIELLDKKYGIRFTGTGTKTIKLVYATYEQSKYLSLPKGYPLISISCVSYDSQGQPCHQSLQLIVGDKFELYL